MASGELQKKASVADVRGLLAKIRLGDPGWRAIVLRFSKNFPKAGVE